MRSITLSRVCKSILFFFLSLPLQKNSNWFVWFRFVISIGYKFTRRGQQFFKSEIQIMLRYTNMLTIFWKMCRKGDIVMYINDGCKWIQDYGSLHGDRPIGNSAARLSISYNSDCRSSGDEKFPLWLSSLRTLGEQFFEHLLEIFSWRMGNLTGWLWRSDSDEFCRLALPIA